MSSEELPQKTIVMETDEDQDSVVITQGMR